MFVCCECCVLSGRGFCDELITRPEKSYRLWCVIVCDPETLWMRRPWSTGGYCDKNNQILPRAGISNSQRLLHAQDNTYTQKDTFIYRAAHKSIENNGNILNMECNVTFAPLCVSMCLVAYFPRGWSRSLHSLVYGYIGVRTDTTQQTNICVGIHCRNVWLHLNRQPFCPLQRHSNSMRTAASIWPDCRLETNSLCWLQTVGGDNIPVV